MTKLKQLKEKFHATFGELDFNTRKVLWDWIQKALDQAEQRTKKEIVAWARDNNFFATYKSIGNEKLETRCVDYEEILSKLKHHDKN